MILPIISCNKCSESAMISYLGRLIPMDGSQSLNNFYILLLKASNAVLKSSDMPTKY